MGRCEGSAVRAVSSAKLYLYCELSKRKGRVAGVETNGEGVPTFRYTSNGLHVSPREEIGKRQGG